MRNLTSTSRLGKLFPFGTNNIYSNTRHAYHPGSINLLVSPLGCDLTLQMCGFGNHLLSFVPFLNLFWLNMNVFERDKVLCQMSNDCQNFCFGFLNDKSKTHRVSKTFMIINMICLLFLENLFWSVFFFWNPINTKVF